MNLKHASIALFCAAALAAAGCGQKDGENASSAGEPKGTSPSTTAASATKEGWVEVKSEGFSFSIPDDWKAIDLASGDLDAIISAASEANEGVKKSEAMIRSAAASGAIKVMVFGPPKGDFTPNVNVVVMDQPVTPSADQLKQSYEAEIKSMTTPGSEIESEAVTLPAGEGYHMHSTLAMGNLTISSTAYLLAKDKKTYTITFSAPMEDKEKMESLAREVMETLKIG